MSLYQRLTDPASFRLLRVHRDAYGAVVCELRVFVYGARGTPQYLPVSCDTGNRSRQVTVSINGHRVSVSRTAFEVLELVSDQPAFLYRPWLFLESICIDQENLDEQAAYVALRTRIFGESNGALIWLGPAHQDSGTGMEMMRLAAQTSKHEDPRLKDPQCWKAYQSIVQRPWWRCLSTLYESIAPQVHREILYYCGTERVTGREVIWAAAETPRLLSQMHDHVLGECEAWAPMFARRRIWQWYRGIEPGERITLLSMLPHNAGCTVEDDRKRIYALLGCVKQRDRDLVASLPYDMPVEAMYARLVQEWIIQHQSLDILSFAAVFRDHQGKARTLPSWVPDWSVAQDDQTIKRCRNPVPFMVSQSTKPHINNLRSMDQLKVPTDALTYAAAGNTSPQAQFTETGQVLRLQGIVLDAIDGLAGTPGGQHSHSDLSDPVVQPTSPFNCLADLELGVSSSRAIDKQYGELDVVGDIMREDVLMSLVVGRADDCLHHKAEPRLLNTELHASLAPTGDCEDKQSDLRREFLAWLQLNANFKVCSRTLGTLLGLCSTTKYDAKALPVPSKPTRKDYSGLLRRFHTTTGADAWDMRLAVTLQGYVGMAPRAARKGDLICVVLGYSVPAVLRRRDDSTFEFVGECYMQGFMEGQALQDNHQIETFDIS